MKIKLNPTRNSLRKPIRQAMIEMLNQQLSDAVDLGLQAKQAHWNVKGEEFIALHKLFDEFAEALAGYVDVIAERAVQLGGTALGTNRMSADNTRLEEYPIEPMDSMSHVEALIQRYAMVAASTRTAIDIAEEAGDMGTVDMFSDISRGMDKWLWFLEAHVQP